MSKTLVIQPLPGIGDMVWHLPHLKAIAAQAPGGTIAVLTKRRSLADQLFDGIDWVSDVHWLERAQGGEPAGRHDGLFGVTRLARDLRRLRVETVWILHHSWRYAAAARLAGITSRIGYRELPTQSRRLHQAEKATELLRVHGLTVNPTPRYTPTDRARTESGRLYGDLPRPWLVLGIGASETFKLWPEERFAALARAYRDRTRGTVILAGGPDDKGPAERIMVGTKGAAVLALGRPLGQAAALAGMADAVVGNDSGLLNLAAATGTRCVGLFGGSEPLTLYPNLEALEPEHGAVYRENRMDGIEVEAVMQALSRALATSPSPGV